MLLPQSFGVFVLSNTARPFSTLIEGATDSYVYTDAFGLAGIYNSDTGELRITVAQRPGLDFRVLVSGTVGLYRVLENTSDYLVTEVALSPDMLKKTKANTYWEINVRTELDPSELMLVCILEDTSNNSTATWTPVESTEKTQVIRHYVERFRTTLDVLPESQLTTKTITEIQEASTDYLKLDFGIQDAPVVFGSGSLNYVGGGNRWLFDNTGVGIDQLVNQAPWTIPSSVFVESGSHNYLSDSELKRSLHRTTSSSALVSQVVVMDVPAFPGHQALSYAISGPSGLDTYWEFETEVTTTQSSSLTGSLYLEATPSGSRNFDVLVGLRIRSGNTVREVTKQTNTRELGNLGLVYVSSYSQTPAIEQTSLFVRVLRLCPGDRFECTIAVPQIESAGTATSRIKNNSTRAPDQLSWVPDDPTYDFGFGSFGIRFYAAYTGIPIGLGDQYLFDTRDQVGEAGCYCVHRSSGLLEFGIIGDDISDSWIVESASTLELIYGKVFDIKLCFDTNQAKMYLNSTLIGEAVYQQVLQVPDFPVIRIGRNYLDQQYVSAELLGFSLSSEPILQN